MVYIYIGTELNELAFKEFAHRQIVTNMPEQMESSMYSTTKLF